MSIPTHVGESVKEKVDGYGRIEDTPASWGTAAYSWEDSQTLKSLTIKVCSEQLYQGSKKLKVEK